MHVSSRRGRKEPSENPGQHLAMWHQKVTGEEEEEGSKPGEGAHWMVTVNWDTGGDRPSKSL